MSDNREKIGKNNPPKHSRFSATNQPEKSGRTKGSQNRSTLIRKWAEGEDVSGITKLDKIVLAQITKAEKGDTLAFDRIMDGIFGRIADKLIAENKTEFSSDLTKEDARQLINDLLKKK